MIAALCFSDAIGVNMLNDTHVHTEFSSDSTEKIENQIERAIFLGMKILTVTDHHDYDAVNEEGMTFILDFDKYFEKLRQLKEQYKNKIKLLTGIEMGLQLHIKDYIKDIVEKYSGELDFVIGSSHFIDGHDIYYPSFYENSNERECYFRYFNITLKRILEINDFDSLGHLDYVVRYGPNKNKFYNYAAYSEVLDKILISLIKREKSLEINTAGFKYNLNTTNPSYEVLKRYYDLGGRLITVGSDAHNVNYLGDKFDILEDMLKKCGFKKYFVYEKRQPIAIML